MKKTYTLVITDHGVVTKLQYDSMVQLQDDLIEWLQTRCDVMPFHVDVILN